MLRRHTLITVALVPALALGAAACGTTAADSSATPLTGDAQAGKLLTAARCLGCHSLDGKSRSGPTFKGLAGSTVTLEGGATVTADTDYLIRSIVDPSAEVVDTYPNIMGSAVPKNSVSQEQARQMALYIETLK